MGLMAGYGLQLWPILQDIHQLRSLYGTSAGTFLSNAGVLQAFGVNDFDTADMLSKTMGRETITYETGGQSEKDVIGQRPRTIFEQNPTPRRPQPHGPERDHEARAGYAAAHARWRKPADR